MRKTDMNKYTSNSNYKEKKSSRNKKYYFNLSLKLIGTIFLSLFITGSIVLSYLVWYMFGMSGETIAYDMHATKLHLTSFIYVNDENNMPVEYDKVFNLENRIWVDFNEIPQYMKDAIISIEDKRFNKHKGVDFVRTCGAVTTLFSGKSTYGGSTLTQQLIKNLTDDSDFSLTRKVREIFRAINFEKEYSKDEILEAYLNVVNFGAGCRGVQAAAKLYLKKDIKDCTIEECAAIAGITQNPAAYNPLVYPENNKKRREIVLASMYEQEKISKEQYEKAMAASEKMTFSKDDDDSSNKESYNPVRNWYMEAMFEDIVNDLSETLKISKGAAQEMLYTQGLKIYSAMDMKAQSIAEEVIKNKNIMSVDDNLELGYMMIDYNGRVLATVGSRKEKTANLVFDRANSARRQPGSTIKPIASYAPAIDLGLFNYSSIIPDEKIPNFYSNKYAGPNNVGNFYRGNITLQYALEVSSNAVAARILQSLTPQKSYNFMVNKLGFTSLDESDKQSLVGLSIGGLYNGVTVREMTAAFQIFGNGGVYNKPYTYYYVLDRNGNVLLDNRDKIGARAIKSETATIMNRLLRNVVVGESGTGRRADIPNWDVIGKTGTTDNDKDSWFIGATPAAVAGIWSGYDTPKSISQTKYAQTVWKEIMSKYLEGRKPFDYTFDQNVIEKYYSPTTGQIVSSEYFPGSKKGYYAKDSLPKEDPNSKFLQAIEEKVIEQLPEISEVDEQNSKPSDDKKVKQEKSENKKVDNIPSERI